MADSSPRVISLLPSATEILHAVGGIDLLVGRSHECDWPDSIAEVPTLTSQRTDAAPSAEIAAPSAEIATTSAEIAAPSAEIAAPSADIDRQVRESLSAGVEGAVSLYRLDVDRLRGLRPDVILTQDLCPVCSIDLGTVRDAAKSMTPAPLVLSLDPKSVEDVLDDVLRVGEAIDRADAAEAAMVALRERYWTAVDHVNPYVDGPSVAFLEWMDPLFVAGHWTPQMIEAAGGRHVLNPPGARSRSIEADELVDARPECLIICPCGYGLDAIDRELDTLRGREWWRRLPAVRDGRVMAIDGSQMFNRPGPRLVDAFRWLVGWLNGVEELMEEGFPARLVGD